MLIAAGLLFGIASVAAASSIVVPKGREPLTPRASVTDKDRSYDGHPLAQAASNRDVKIEITSDRVFRSCCKPPDLMVGGKVTNTTAQAINYVRLVIAMKDAGGHVVYTEDTYNHGAVTMFEDPAIAKLLNDRPHFDPLAPGASDTFTFAIPLSIIPRYKSVVVLATDVVPSHSVARSR